jgi:predicted nucleic acid-binding protein
MMFWDASALIPLCVREARTPLVRQLLSRDPVPVVWWATPVECRSAFARLRREGVFDQDQEQQAARPLALLQENWMEILPGTVLRDKALRLLAVHELRAADSLQLAAALIWAGDSPSGRTFVCLDNKLRAAAQREGFWILPEV